MTHPSWNDPECFFVGVIPKEQTQTVARRLDPEEITHTGCRVIKHPDACILCVANDDCRKLPMHVHCRCKREFYFEKEILPE